MLKKTLAQYQTDIYWLHDQEDFQGLSDKLSELYQLLGYETEKAALAGKWICEAYKIADEAEAMQKKQNPSKERELYMNAADSLRKAEDTLGYDKSTAVSQALWWMYFRRRNVIKAVFYLFKQQYDSLGKRNLLSSLRITLKLINVGLCHNKRDKKRATEEAEKYWALLLDINCNGEPYIG